MKKGYIFDPNFKILKHMTRKSSIIKIYFIAICFIFNSISLIAQEKYEIKIRVKGVNNKFCKIAYYFGNNTYLEDSAKSDSKGNFVFKGNKKLPHGMYLFVLPSRNYFEFVIDGNNFSLETDSTDFISNMKVKNSPENDILFAYNKFILPRSKKLDSLSKSYEKVKDDSKKTEEIKTLGIKYDQEIKDYRSSVVKNQPNSFLAHIFKSMIEPVVPEAPTLSNGRKDSLFQFNYYKKHYWDNFDFTDDRLVRTHQNVFFTKMKNYLENMTLQAPDSVNKEADFLLSKAPPKSDMFKFILFWITYNYETSKLMGADGVFVHLSEKYYMKDKAYWLDSSQVAKIKEKAMKLKPILIGKIAPNITVQNMKGEYISLHDVQSKFTVVYFWDPECGHCQKVTPALKLAIDTLASKGVKVFGVCTEPEAEKVKKAVEKYSLQSWINVIDPYNTSGFRKFYDIVSTPQMYLLNDKKEIIAKQISTEQLSEIIKVAR